MFLVFTHTFKMAGIKMIGKRFLSKIDSAETSVVKKTEILCCAISEINECLHFTK